ncbi:MAG: alpha-L-fucosidase [Planctomycetota bacterium]
MKQHYTIKWLIAFFAMAAAASNGDTAPSTGTAPPEPYGSTPSSRQMIWHELEFYGFLHFTTNTFTDKEWGFGDESPNIFNPTDFSADQIVSTAKMAGMKGLILTCKHHDGFCLWPSQYTEHSVKNSSWKDGKGDVVREISDACKKHDLKFGVYLSPWDRNHPEYARPAYVTYFRNQLRELLTQYGPIFEVWFDGANGGDGYYGGAKEKRTIDRATYYGWEKTWAIVRKLQPDAVIFSDVGEDIRWVGNEKGWAGDPCWAAYTPRTQSGHGKPAPGLTISKEGINGHRDGEFWMPAEVDVSIRPGWFYHSSQDSRVRSPENLLKIYYESIGRGASFLLNLPPDRRGRIHENDVASLTEFRRILDETFAVNFAKDADITASNTRGKNDSRFAAIHLLDGNRKTYWTCDDAVKDPELVVRLKTAVTFNVVDIREYLPLGQRVDTWALDKWVNEQWVEFAAGQAIGSRRLWRGDRQTTDRVRLRLSGPVCPAISEFGLYAEPIQTPKP